MDVRLILRRKGKATWTAKIQCSQATLGRAVGCTIRVPASDVSRLHCRLHIENGLVLAEDLESVNGTFINGVRVRDTEVVRPGDRLSLGSLTFVVEYELSPEAQERLAGEVVEAVEDVEVVEDPGSQPVVEVVVEPLEKAEEVGTEAYVFAEEELNLPGGGDDLNNLLSALDDTEDRSKKRKK